MNGRRAKTLRRMAERMTIGKAAEVTRKVYQRLKRLYLVGMRRPG
jgi:hypothetical protein